MFSNYHIDEPQDNCSLSETNLTKRAPVCTDLSETNYVEIPATTNISESETQPLEFVYKGSPGIYLDLQNTQIYMVCALTKKDGTPVVSDEEVGPINLLCKY